MKISGFTLVRNGTSYDYPYRESIRSLLPLVDELIINVDPGTDDTLEQIRRIADSPEARDADGHSKIKILESQWDLSAPENRQGGHVLSEETNRALAACQYDWCFYLQADEVLHESDRQTIRSTLETHGSRSQVEGFLFHYVHFYGSYDVVQQSRSAYRREVRIVKKSSGAKSVGDAQSFRKADGSKLRVVDSTARVFHYGWVRPPDVMKKKTYFMDQLYHGNPTPEEKAAGQPRTGENYRYKRFWGLSSYRGTHPAVMESRIEKKGWHWDLSQSPFIWHWKDLKKVVLDTVERVTGARLFEYRNYHLIR